MKVTIETNEEKEQEITFPCLMASKGGVEIILVTEKTEEGIKGFVVANKQGGYRIGHFCNGWNEDCFQPLPKGTKVILEN